MAALALLGAAIGAPPAAQADPQTPVRVELRPMDDNDIPVPARLQAVNAQGLAVPGYADSVLLSHEDNRMGGWFYPDGGSAVLYLNPGTYTFQASHGFEWRPVRVQVAVVRDTVIDLHLTEQFDLRSEGWYPGDNHVHGNHPVIDIPMTPSDMMRVAEAEDLSMLWDVDNTWNFTGGPSPLSTPETILYFTTEWRNQVYGHAPILNLHSDIGSWCCEPPLPAWPLLSITRETWNPDSTQAMVLGHPQTAARFFDDNGWPAWGLGRELPVLASSGNLDALDVASYSNVGDEWTQSWIDLENCGLRIPVSAGTDAVVDRYFSRPPGGYRVYVHELGGAHTPSRWVSALRAGRTFITNGPLIREFTVDGAEAGAVLDRTGPARSVHVRVRVSSVLAPGVATLLVNGTAARTWPIPWSVSSSTWTMDDDVVLTEGSWLAVRIDGQTTLTWIASNQVFAMSGAVQVRMDGLVPRRTASAAALADWVDSLQTFTETRGNWPNEADHDEALLRFQASRSFYNSLFLAPPQAFALLSPSDGDTLNPGVPITFDWADAFDPEPGDRLYYRLEISADPFFAVTTYRASDTASSHVVPAGILAPDSGYYWRVSAIDRGGNQQYGTPSLRRLRIRSTTQVQPDPGDAPRGPLRLIPHPNPTPGSLQVDLAGRSFPDGQLEIYAPGGERVARIPVRSGATTCQWDGRSDQGRSLPSGAYWMRFLAAAGAPSTQVRSVRILLLR